MLSEKHHNPHRGGTEAYIATEHYNEGWNGALAAVRKVLGSSLAAAIHYPDCWDTAAYPTIESALAEIGDDFLCTNDDCPHHSTSIGLVSGTDTRAAENSAQQGSNVDGAACTHCKEYRDATGELVLPLCRCKVAKADEGPQKTSPGREPPEDTHLDTDQIISFLLSVPVADKALHNLCEQAAQKLFSFVHHSPATPPQQTEPRASDSGALGNVQFQDPLQHAALVAEIEWCLDEGHCGPRTRAVLKRIRDHQAGGQIRVRRPMLSITLRQAESLERFFGGHDAEVAVVPYKDGLLAWNIECPDEGSQWLGPTEVDDELADKGRPDTSQPAIWKTTHPAVCVPTTESKAIADGWKEHGYEVVEFYPGPQNPRVCMDISGAAESHAIADGNAISCDTASATPTSAAEGPR